MNHFFVTGRVGADAHLKYTPNGTAVCEFSLADTEKQGETFVTSWWNVTLWAQSAEIWTQHLRKGVEVAVCGRMTKREWTNKEGKKQMADSLDRVSWIRLCWKPDPQVHNTPADATGPSL